MSPPLVPFLYPERVLWVHRGHGVDRYAVGTKHPALPENRRPEVVARARQEGLRSIARDFGVSHETVRTVLRIASPAG